MTLLAASTASAQVFGTFSWQMQPYCNIVTLTITQIPGGYTIDGNDNQCGVGGKLAGAAGMALLNPDGTVGLEFTIVTAPSGKAVHVSASISPATGSGPWTDSVGNTGNFALGSPGSGSPRPLPASGIGASLITTTEIAAGAVGASDINTAEVQARVSGTCAAGQAVTAVNADGTVACASTGETVVQFKLASLSSLAAPTGATTVTSWSATPVYNLGGGTYTAATGSYAVPLNGLYLLTTAVGLAANPGETANRCVFFAIGGSPDVGACRGAASTSSEALTASSVVSLSAGQVVTVRVQNNTPAGTTIQDLSVSGFTVTRLR